MNAERAHPPHVSEERRPGAVQRPPTIGERRPTTTPVAAGRNTRQATPSRREQRRRREAWRRRVPILATVGAVAIVILIFILLARGQNGASSSGLASASVVQVVTHVSDQVSNTVQTGGLPDPLIAISPPTTPLTGLNGKPEVLYIGAEYCPYCAAERWSLIVALSRFGTFSNLHTTTSSSTDIYPDTPTFTFVGSTYTSPYLAFTPKEIEDRLRNPLQTLTSAEQQVFNTYDAPPYTSQQNAGGIPFIYLGNRYITLSSGYSPDVLANHDWQSIANGLSDPTNPITRDIVGNANYLTAALCQMTQNQPSAVCQSTAIQNIVKNLPKSP